MKKRSNPTPNKLRLQGGDGGESEISGMSDEK